jgi:hypothetical protein
MLKMEDISNKTILMLVMVALVVSVAGTMISLDRLTDYQNSYGFITGAATSNSQGNTTITNSGTVSITLADSSIAIATGYVNTSSACNGVAVLNLFGGSNQNGCWLNTSDLPPANADLIDHHQVENDGTVLVNLTAYSTQLDAEDWLCGSVGGCTSAVASVTLQSTDGESGSCNSNIASNTTLLGSSSNSSVWICEGFDYLDSTDTINVSLIELRIPSDAPTGTKTLNIVYEATERT